MRIAAIADIHGNLDALEAVLARIAALGADLVVNLGDHLSGPLDAAGTAARLRAEPGMLCLRGNHDRYLAGQNPAAMGPSDAHAHAQLGAPDLAWLAALPASLTPVAGVAAFHAAPASDETYLLEEVRRDGMLAARPAAGIAALLEGVEAGLILTAHTHLPRAIRLPDGRQVVNPGSVGCPAYADDRPVPHTVQSGTPDAVFALAERTPRGWAVSHHHVPYDSARMTALARAAGRADWAAALATGWIAPGA